MKPANNYKFPAFDGSVPTIVETYDGNGNYTGKYRLVNVPCGSIDLPGRGGRVTIDAARRAVDAYRAGGNGYDAEKAANNR